MLSPDELPREEIAILGPTGARRIDTLVHDIVESSAEAGDIRQSTEIGEAMLALRRFMFERVYLAPQARSDNARAQAVVRTIFEHLIDKGEPVQPVIDYVAGMTDRFALAYAAEL